MSDVTINPKYAPMIGDWFNPNNWTWEQAHQWIIEVETCGIPFNRLDFIKAQSFNHIIILDPCNTVRRINKKDSGKYAKRKVTHEMVLFC